ncbi:hypothetical protein BFP97_16955 [Roseivirga sp. 4D4]|nr:hypothetical protein BFP97_16955 [Roseivirga sp. 4D4]
MLNCCASTQPEPLYFRDGIANLAGMWVDNTESRQTLDVLLGIDLNDKSTEIQVMGERVKHYKVRTYENQFLIVYETIEGRKFSVLAQMKNKNEMRITRTEEAVNGFVPLGQLGERVFHLRRISSKKELIASSNTPSGI